MLASSTSPYQLNPLGINPLRDLITRHIDIDALNSPSAPALYVTVTNVKTGMPRVVANGDMSVDVLLASACLPELFQAVEIDGVPYWDGGYSGNPTLWPMIQGGGTRDLIVVQLAPDEVDRAPTDASGIRRRIGEIVFNSSLVAEMQAISAMRALAGGTDVRSSVIDTRLHRIGPPPPALFAHGSSFERSREWLLRLYDEGRRAARRFIARHGANVGVRETLDVSRVFADDRSSMMYRSANDETFAVTGAPISRALM
jgi:NTE family protein